MGEIGGVVDFEGNFFVFFGDFVVGFDVVGVVVVVVVDGGYEDDLFEVGDVDYFYVCCVRVGVVGVGGGEVVDFVGDDFVVGGEVGDGDGVVFVNGGGGVVGGEVEGSVLFWGVEVFVFFLFVDIVFEVGGDEGVVGWVVDVKVEGESVVSDYSVIFCNEFCDFGVDFGGVFFVLFLVYFEVVEDGGEEIFNICKLVLVGGDF